MDKRHREIGVNAHEQRIENGMFGEVDWAIRAAQS
jgi:hypothetical protein